MIQRIQTLFLVIGAGLLIAMLCTPMATIVGVEGADGRIGYFDYISAFTLIILSLILQIIAILGYKQRVRQMRLCILNALVLLGLQIYLVVIYFSPAKDDSILFTITTIFPVCALILDLIAARYIARDEALVMASSRLRSKKK